MSNQFKLKHRIFSEPLETRVLLSELAWEKSLEIATNGNGIAVDSAGNVYVASSSTSYAGYYVTASVSKYSSSGEFLWQIPLGSEEPDHANAITVDASGFIYVAGATDSSGWISGGADESYGGETDGFLVKLASNGSLQWSTYFGGEAYDAANSIAVDEVGNVFLTGTTSSSGWIAGGFDTSFNGNFRDDAFVIKLNAAGNHVWSTYLGGTNFDHGEGIAIASGNVYVTGDTTSSGWTENGIDTSYNGGNQDAFVAKLSGAGGHVWSTYLGGAEDDEGDAISIDASGNLYITGDTKSPGWIHGGFDTSFNSLGDRHDAFVVKLKAAGDHIWSTYVGTSSSDYAFDLAIDETSNIYLIGGTTSSSWIVDDELDLLINDNASSSLNPLTVLGGADAFVMKLSSSGKKLLHTRFGGSGGDYGTGIAVDPNNNVYVTGTSWAASPNNTFGSAFVAKILPLTPFNVVGSSAADLITISRLDNTITANVNGVITTRRLSSTSNINISTGNGNDTITLADDVLRATIDAGAGNDRIIGSDNDDSIRAGAGDDYVLANAGNDTVNGGDGKDTITGSTGKDKLYGENDEDRINSANGNDTIFGGAGDDRMYGDQGDDFIDGGGGVDRAWGDFGNDTLIGGGSNDKLDGYQGDDRMIGNAGDDAIDAGADNDTILGGTGDDHMRGGTGDDSIDGGDGVDQAWGDTGNDTLIGGGSNDKLYGEGGSDRFFGNAGADLISGGSGTDAAKDEDDENLYSSIESYF